MRLIDADELRGLWLENGENEYIYDTNAVLDSIDEAPTIDPKDLQPHGRWDGDHCTNCGGLCVVTKDAAWRTRYCPDCGAKMDEGGEE